MNYSLSTETKNVLNAIGENIFIADGNFDIVWINEYSERLIQRLSKYIPIKSAEDIIGKNISMFHQNVSKQRRILQGALPHETTINLFHELTASIVIKKFMNGDNEQGYMLTWKDVTDYETEKKEKEAEFRQKMGEYQKHLEEVASNLIPLSSTVGLFAMMPTPFGMDTDRFEEIGIRLIENAQKLNLKYLIVDVSKMTSIGMVTNVPMFKTLIDSMHMSGIKVVLSGVGPELARQLVHSSVQFDSTKSFGKLEQAVNYVNGIT
ncbi:hypothetical protein [Peribacillus sp. SCS-155]|uniref:hypothetical protein n=1 Tax=Peribacillus sedimenti TaxID=3115297 RepID=UPI00390584F7